MLPFFQTRQLLLRTRMFLGANSVLLLVIEGYIFISHLQMVQNSQMGDFELWKNVLAGFLVWFGLFFPKKVSGE